MNNVIVKLRKLVNNITGRRHGLIASYLNFVDTYNKVRAGDTSAYISEAIENVQFQADTEAVWMKLSFTAICEAKFHAFERLPFDCGCCLF